MAIDFDSNLPIYIQVMDYIKKEIVSGRLKPGDRVDSVRDLALHFGVNPNTVQHIRYCIHCILTTQFHSITIRMCKSDLCLRCSKIRTIII